MKESRYYSLVVHNDVFIKPTSVCALQYRLQ